MATAAAAAAAAAGALKPFAQLKGRSGREWLCSHQQSIGQPMRLMATRTLSTSRQQKQCAGAVASATSSRPSSIYQYSSSYSSPIDNRNQQSTALCSKKMDIDDNNNNNNNTKLTPEKLDQWIRNSVGEIVSNIGDAPFLVHIFSNGPMLRLEKEEALPESWPGIKKRWDQGTCMPPDGVILVEELKDEEGAVGNGGTKGVEEEANRTWGLVVQGKGMDCASCYILNTCRVRSTMGFCTHFCLLRAKCFGDPFKVQIRKAWLQCR